MVMESLQRLDPPQALGKLTLLARLGEGGMATVYVAATGHGVLARLCAVKMLRADVADPEFRTRFRDEAALVVRLHHNNLVDVREAGERDGQLFIAMELCEGRDLADLWDRCAAVGRAFPVALSVFLVREALRGLHYAHRFDNLSLVHRDVSPSNLLIDWNGAVRVADFGLATSVLKVTETVPGLVFGKVGYMAPEQAMRGVLDARADVYACGAVLWELLTGRPMRAPSTSTNDVARFSAPRPSTLSRRVDPMLDDIVVKALALEPGERYADAGEFMRALSLWLVNHAPQTDQDTLADFMRGLFPDAQRRDHEVCGELLQAVAGPTTGVFARGATARETRGVEPIDVPPNLSDDLPPGLVVADRYRIQLELGRGGMGTVYLAEHVTVGRRVAVKVLTREWSAHETVARRFREEARAASAVGHPNIVEVFDAGTLPDGRLYLVMEHLQGRSLWDEIVANGVLPVAKAIAIFTEIAKGIAAAHAAGIIHRDLKPDNVMLVQRGGELAVKLLDFGISASADRSEGERRLTQPGHALGTPEYMAPEQAKGHPPTALIDIYALGAMLYEMLAGEPPFVGDNYVEVLTRKATERAPSLAARRSDAPASIVALCHACLEIDPARRPSSAAAVLGMLASSSGAASSTTALEVASHVAPPEVTLREPPRAATSRRFPVLAVAIGVALVGAGAAGAWMFLRAPSDAGADARRADAADASASGPSDPTKPSVAATEPRPPDPAAGNPEPSPTATRPDPGSGSPTRPDPTSESPTNPDPGSGSPTSPPTSPTSATADVAAPEAAATDARKPTGPAKPSSPKPSTPAPPQVDSAECVAERAAAKKAASTLQWSSVLASTGTRGCWSGAHRATREYFRVRGYFELHNYRACASEGKGATGKDAATIAKRCAELAAG
jgi:serine/threonine-protein kinase